MNAPIVGIPPTPAGDGYSLPGRDRGVFTPAQPGAHGILTEIGPGASLVQAITLDSAGTARSVFAIPSAGVYALAAAVTVDGVTQQSNVVVTVLPPPPTNTGTPVCPSPT